MLTEKPQKLESPSNATDVSDNATEFTIAENVDRGNLVIAYQLLNFGTTTPATAAQPVSFEYRLTDVTTTKNSDYMESNNRTETVQIGSSIGRLSIPITDDIENEGNETFILEFFNIVNGSKFTGQSITYKQTISIIDNELPTLSITNTELSVVENIGAGGFVVQVMLSGSTADQNPATDGDVTFNYTLSDGTATVDSDYTLPAPSARSFTIAEGDLTASFAIPILDDAASPMSEGSETFDITINITKGARFGNNRITRTRTITIHDNELPTLTFQTEPISAIENNEDAVISVGVKLSVSHHQDVTFQYDMTDITTTKGIDYIEDGTRIGTVSKGNNSGTFTIPLTDDLISEENETFTITLSRPNNAVFAANAMMISKTATIEDNEPPILKITTTDFTVDENVGATGFQLAFELSNPTDQEVSFQYDVTDGTAEEGVDYTRPVLAARMIRIPIGNTTRTIMIPILEDSLNEGNETFTFSLLSSSVSGAVLEDNATEYTQTITIEDDEDPTLSITPTTFEVFEDIGNLVVEFKLSGPTDSDVTFKYDLNDGDTTKGTDYTEAVEAERNLTIRRGDLTTTISIPIDQ